MALIDVTYTNMALPQTQIDVVVQSMDRDLAQSVWRGDQMASFRSLTEPSGFAALDAELPGGGWPKSALTELLIQQPGIGEIRLLLPALANIAKKSRIAFVEPPHTPHIAAWTSWGLDADKMLMVKTRRTSDALWAAEQILRNGSCGALLFWQPQVRTEALRRLQLASQASDTMFWLVRPLSAGDNSSPAPLRLALTPATGGVNVHVVKRRGPQHEQPVFIALPSDYDARQSSDFAPFRAPQKVEAVSNPGSHVVREAAF